MKIDTKVEIPEVVAVATKFLEEVVVTEARMITKNPSLLAQALRHMGAQVQFLVRRHLEVP